MNRLFQCEVAGREEESFDQNAECAAAGVGRFTATLVEASWTGMHASRFTAKVAKSSPVSCKTQPRCTDVPDWVTTFAVQPTFWDSDSFNFKCHGRQVGTQEVQPWRRVGLGRCRATQPRCAVAIIMIRLSNKQTADAGRLGTEI